MKAIEAHHLSKKYILSHQSKTKGVPASKKDKWWLPNKQHNTPLKTEDFWSLQDVSFDVNHGQRIGIVGKNGSGKSTLLKILSRITPPTSGHAIIRGRVISLLEVGTGFHPEFTGRENIFLNGAILGMRKKETMAKFNEIVNFADIEKFLDMPIKHYSSGMYVRLAFSIASHLEPDILIADEVLAVGDVSFQQKCVQKMKDIGSAILFVSHNATALKNVCDSALLLENGRLITYENTDAVIDSYLNNTTRDTNLFLDSRADRDGTGLIRFNHFYFTELNEEAITTAHMGQAVTIFATLQAKDEFILNTAAFVVSIISSSGEKVTCFYKHVVNENRHFRIDDIITIKIAVESLTLVPGIYNINLSSTINDIMSDCILNASIINIVADDVNKKTLAPSSEQGLCYIAHQFTLAL